MDLHELTREFVPGTEFHERDRTTQYWIRDGQVVYRAYPVRGADPESFRFYLGAFGKDHRHCYSAFRRLKGGIGSTFRALNFTYATDGVSVWTLGGKCKDADAESFTVCDDGLLDHGGGIWVPYGFGKDRFRVFYYDFDGKPNWVRKASPASFVSLNDGVFGKDDHSVFYGAYALPKADPEHWRVIGGSYSTDGLRVYHGNREIHEADCDSFEVVPVRNSSIILAKDKHHHYYGGRVVSEAVYARFLERFGPPASSS